MKLDTTVSIFISEFLWQVRRWIRGIHESSWARYPVVQQQKKKKKTLLKQGWSVDLCRCPSVCHGTHIPMPTYHTLNKKGNFKNIWSTSHSLWVAPGMPQPAYSHATNLEVGLCLGNPKGAGHIPGLDQRSLPKKGRFPKKSDMIQTKKKTFRIPRLLLITVQQGRGKHTPPTLWAWLSASLHYDSITKHTWQTSLVPTPSLSLFNPHSSWDLALGPVLSSSESRGPEK